MIDAQTTRYFGPRLPAHLRDAEIEVPIGAVCLLCTELVDEHDSGTINWANQITHHECMMRSVIGSVGHLIGRCSCYGGAEDDPPGMTRRQAAIAAVKLYYALEHGDSSE